MALPVFVKGFYVYGKCLDTKRFFHFNQNVIFKPSMHRLKFIGRLNDENPWPLWLICLIILLILLIAGLWPLNFRAVNKVTWLKSQNGVRFYGQGIIFGPDIRNPGQKPPFSEKSITLELWLRPLQEMTSLPHILTFHDGKSLALLVVGQWKSHLVIRSRKGDPRVSGEEKSYREIGLQNGLIKNHDTFITLTSGSTGTIVYLDGKAVRSYSNYNILADVTENPLRFVLGNSPTGESFWIGDLLGFAVYNRELSATEVSKRHQAWTGKASFAVSSQVGCLGMYLFDERQGSMIYNKVDIQERLTIPEVFEPVQRKILTSFRQGFRWNFSYLQDIVINVIGFIPFGFFFYALLLNFTRRRRWSTSVVVFILGAGLSIAIEVGQAYLPTRDSSLTDAAMNAVGTALGVAIKWVVPSYPADSHPEPGNRFRSS